MYKCPQCNRTFDGIESDGYTHYPPSSTGDMISADGRCAYSCSTCKDNITKCDVCGYNFCDYHFPKHKRPLRHKCKDGIFLERP